MSFKKLLLTCAMIGLIGSSGFVGALAGGGAVYWAVRDRLQQPAPVVSQPISTSASSETTPAQILHVDVNSAVEDAVARVSPAVVTVINTLPAQAQTDFFGFPTGQTTTPQASGSGVIVSKDGYVITNQHVVQGYSKLEVVFRDGQTVEAKLVGSDDYADIAVLKIEGPLPAVAEFGNSDALNPGEAVIAIGSPLGDFKNTVTVGVVSGTGRSINTSQGYQMEDLIQTDAAINHGNSGGPLVNLAGQVIGINTLVVRGDGGSSDQAEGLGFAIAANTVKAVSDQLVSKGFVARPYMGISWATITPAVARANGLAAQWGVYIKSVGQGSPADTAGVRAGDILTQLGDTPLDETHPFINAMWSFTIGQEVPLTILREGQTLTLKVVLGERPRP